MTAIVATAAQVDRVFPDFDEVIPCYVIEAVTRGQAASQATTGFQVADANDSGHQQFRGVYLESGVAGDIVPVLKRGVVSGFAVSGLNADAIVYLSDTAGSLDDAAGTMTVRCGRVIIGPDKSTKLVYIDADWTAVWS